MSASQRGLTPNIDPHSTSELPLSPTDCMMEEHNLFSCLRTDSGFEFRSFPCLIVHHFPALDYAEADCGFCFLICVGYASVSIFINEIPTPLI